MSINQLPSGLLLPGSAQGLTIHVPRGHETQPTMVCSTPVGEGETCGAVFYPGQESRWQAHIGRCAREHMDVIHRESPRARLPIFHDPELGDPEIEAHMRKVGKRMLAEGRMEMRPNERAGF